MPDGNEVMMSEHIYWTEFVDLLAREVRRCAHDHRHTREILALFPNVNIEASIAHFKEHGGHCDCEVMFNVVYGE